MVAGRPLAVLCAGAQIQEITTAAGESPGYNQENEAPAAQGPLGARAVPHTFPHRAILGSVVKSLPPERAAARLRLRHYLIL